MIQWYVSYTSADSLRAGSGRNFRPDPARQLCDIYHCCVYSEKSPDDGQRNCPKYVEFYSKNKFEKLGTAVAQWLKCCVTNRKVTGSISAGVSGFFIDIISFRSNYGPGVDSVSNRNEYQEHFLGVKAAGA